MSTFLLLLCLFASSVALTPEVVMENECAKKAINDKTVECLTLEGQRKVT